MPGAVGSNFHIGSRSEMLADYFFGTFGPVTPVRGHDDFGIDLYCTLIERKGQRSVPTEYYSVQIKSTDDPWIFDDEDSIRWLMEHNNPILLCVVSKQQAMVEVFHTFGRFAIVPDRMPTKLILCPGRGDAGKYCEWDASGPFDLSAPIIRASVNEFFDPARHSLFKQVLTQWLSHERKSLDNRRAGLIRYEMPDEYFTNSTDIKSTRSPGWYPHTPLDIALGIQRLAEALDCVGDQLRFVRDMKTATRAALLLDRLRTRYPEAFPNDQWIQFRVFGLLLSDISKGLGQAGDADSASALEYVQREVDGLERVASSYESARACLDPFRFRPDSPIVE